MPTGPFLDDPRDAFRQQIALAVASPIEEVRAIHLREAEHQAEIAKASKLPFATRAGVARRGAADV